MKKVSVIIPTYNGAKYIERAITSVMAQSYPSIEAMIIDDGSTDNTKEIVTSFQRQYPGKIKYIYQTNAGPAKARNNGLQSADGEYIAFLDVDDQWLSLKIETQVQLFEENPDVGFVYGPVNFVDEDGQILKDYVRTIGIHRGDITLDLFMDFFIITSSLIFRRSCLDKIGYFNPSLKVGEDYEFILRLAKNFSGDAIEDKLINRVVRADSLSRQDYALDARNDIETLNHFIKNNSDFYKKHKMEILKRMGDYHFVFGYRLLENGRNGEAFDHLFRSFCYEPSLNIFKNLCLCAIPYPVRSFLKNKLA
jgi:glycosyltransferase involved in cell wall biosynthesis